MALSKERATEILAEFKSEFKSLNKLRYFILDTDKDFKDVYGSKSEEAIAKWDGKAGGYSRSGLAVAISIRSVHDESEFRKTLVHEAVGHSGINTFTNEEKRGLIDALCKTRESESLKQYWEYVDREYPDISEREKAEEVFCYVIESYDGEKIEYLENAFDYAWENSVSSSNEDLKGWGVLQIIEKMQQGLRDGTREHLIIPERDDMQFSDAYRVKSNKCSAAFDAEAVKGMQENVNALLQDKGLIGRSVGDIEILAYWRGVVQQNYADKPVDERNSALIRFHEAAKNPDFINKLQPELNNSAGNQKEQEQEHSSL